jgi:hypothetical protein
MYGAGPRVVLRAFVTLSDQKNISRINFSNGTFVFDFSVIDI